MWNMTMQKPGCGGAREGHRVCTIKSNQYFLLDSSQVPYDLCVVNLTGGICTCEIYLYQNAWIRELGRC